MRTIASHLPIAIEYFGNR